MFDNNIINTEFSDLMNEISNHFSKEEINWYLSLVPNPTKENKVEIKVSSNTYTNEK
mgnify:FL=1